MMMMMTICCPTVPSCNEARSFIILLKIRDWTCYGTLWIRNTYRHSLSFCYTAAPLSTKWLLSFNSPDQYFARFSYLLLNTLPVQSVVTAIILKMLGFTPSLRRAVGGIDMYRYPACGQQNVSLLCQVTALGPTCRPMNWVNSVGVKVTGSWS
jgi:hypothetical protein